MPVIAISLLSNRHSSEGTCTQIIKALMITPAVPPVSAHQCHLPVPISATSMPHISTYQCTSMPYISAHLSCLSVPSITFSQCHLSVPVHAAYQCKSVPPNSASQ
ncbi:unnamed protein product [Staurois parvus]|uniref:Uncharacterized protein n=1 Tax=Staurois parvus TaxID=386267 RepID=A0ABN9C359_9NEOB|nr:unnamed protein product [Staurois parvus]